MTSQITKDFQMKSKLRKLADGGSRGEGGGLSKEAVMAAIATQRGAPTSTPAPTPAPAPVAVQRPGGDYIRNPRSVLDARERAAGLADGGSAPFGSRGLSGLRDLIPQMEAMGFRQQPAQPDPTGLRAVMPRVKAMGYMDGGRVEGPGGRTDDEVGPVMLSDEEYVLPGDTADAIGRDKLDAIRLATHEFKDERKESKLRKAHGLADGGSPWIADDKGNVRKPNAFGDAAAGSNYTQPKLPPPQTGTAVATQAPPIGQRPPIDITPPGSRSTPMAQTVGAVTDVTPKTAMSRAAGAAKGFVRGGLPLGQALGAYDAAMDARNGYREHFQTQMGVSGPWESVGADLLRTGAGMADSALLGLPGRLGRGIAGVIGGGEDVFKANDVGGALSAMGRNAVKFAEGFMSDSDRDTFLQNKAVADAKAVADTKAGGGKTVPTSPLRSDQGPALPVEPGSYQSRRLSEMGVPLDVQNSKPVVDSVTGNTRDFLRTGGTSQYQNLGTYGGNGNIYGKADDPSRPGRINNFVGVGAGASPQNEYNGSGANGGITSALRGLGKGPSSPGGSGSSGGNSAPADNGAAINARYDKLAKELKGMYGPKGQGNLARRLLELEHSRSGALDADARNVTSRSNAVLQNSTLRDNAQLEALGRMEQSRATALSQAQAAQIKALQDARKTDEARDADSVKTYKSVADTFAAGDKEKAQRYLEVLSTLGPELDQLAQGLTPTDKNAFYTNILRQQIGRDEGLVLGRDVGATVQNAAVGGLVGRMSRLGDGAAGKAIDKALGKLPRVGPVISALRPAENLTRFGTILGAGAGAAMTPEIQEYNRFDPIARDPVSGAALPAREDLREAFTYGAFDTYFNQFSDDVQTVSGRRTNRPNPTEEEAARRFRSTLRTE